MDFIFEQTGKAAGIDLGTANSVVCVLNPDGSFTHLEDGNKQVIKSTMFFNNADDIIFGAKAEARGMIYPGSVLRCFKRGLSYHEAHMQNGKYFIRLAKPNQEGQKELWLEPKEACTLFLSETINQFQEKLDNESIEYLVLTVPAKFSTSMISTLRSAAIDGLNLSDVYIVQEPVAAAICYDATVSKIPNGSNLLVYDLGAGTFDVSLLRKDEEGKLEYADTNGDVHLGGEDFTILLMEFLMNDLMYNYGIDLFTIYDSEDEIAYERNVENIRRQAEKAKEALSSETQYQNTFTLKIHGMNDTYQWMITRNQFEGLISSSIIRTIDKISLLLKRNHMDKDQIDQVLMVGGSSLIPMVKDKLEAYFNGPTKIDHSSDKELMIGRGAAIIASQKYETNENTKLIDAIGFDGMVQKTADTLAISCGNQVELQAFLNRGSKIPFEKTFHFNGEEVMKQKCVCVSFYSYDELEVLNEAKTYDSFVSAIGNYTYQAATPLTSQDQVDIHLTIDEQFIFGIELTINGKLVDQGYVERDEM